MEFKNLIISKDEDIMVIQINRPEKLNALNNELLTELDQIFSDIKSNSSKVIILTGAGDKAFVAGADIKELRNCDLESGREFSLFGQKVFNKIENCGKPVIAAINGYALGGGCELALACSIRIASSRAKFGQPEINLGVIPGYGGTQRFTKLVNSGRAAEYILTGDLFDAEEAFRIGLVNKISAPEDVLSEAKLLAKKIASKGQLAVKAVLSAIQANNLLNLEDGLKLEAELFANCCNTKDFKEGTSAFLEKREPNFTNE